MSDNIGANSLAAWCEARDVSRAKFYLMDQAGEAPETFYVGTRRFVSKAADAKWQRERERQARTPEARERQARRREAYKRAARKAARTRAANKRETAAQSRSRAPSAAA